MATLAITKSGKNTGYNIQWYEGKARRTIYLSGSRYSRKTAEQVKEIVETLLYYRRNGITTPEKKTEHWLKSASKELQEKLAQTGLLVVTKPKTCQELWDSYIATKTDVKPNTIGLYQRSQILFLTRFPAAEPIENITLEKLLEWRTSLLTKYKEATVAGYFKNVKAVLNWATEVDWLKKNPLRKISPGSFRNPNNHRIISMTDYAKLLNACPSQKWRTILALARIGGLRCPSELQPLRWSDVNWSENRFLVHSPKTERHEGHRERIVPLFPELRVELERLFSLGAGEFVIEFRRNTRWNLRQAFRKIAELAGLGRVVCPFTNMRRSRSNEVRRRWGDLKERLWIGHSAKVMQDHYFRLTDEDYSSAAGTVSESQIPHAELHAIHDAVGGLERMPIRFGLDDFCIRRA